MAPHPLIEFSSQWNLGMKDNGDNETTHSVQQQTSQKQNLCDKNCNHYALVSLSVSMPFFF